MGQLGTGKYEQLLERCKPLEPVVTAVVHPCEESALAGAVEAGAKGLITPILVGPAGKIDEVARKAGSISGTSAWSMPLTAMLRQPRPWSWCVRGRPSS